MHSVSRDQFAKHQTAWKWYLNNLYSQFHQKVLTNFTQINRFVCPIKLDASGNKTNRKKKWIRTGSATEKIQMKRYELHAFTSIQCVLFLNFKWTLLISKVKIIVCFQWKMLCEHFSIKIYDFQIIRQFIIEFRCC